MIRCLRRWLRRNSRDIRVEHGPAIKRVKGSAFLVAPNNQTIAYLGIEVDDALEISEQTEI